MVESDVEYIEKDVSAADTDEEGEAIEGMAWQTAAALKLSIPVLCTAFALLFLNSVVGRIDVENLYYPLSVVGTLLVILGTVYITEIRDIYREYTEYSVSVRSDAERLWAEWRKSIVFLIVAVAYLGSVPVLGFFPASFVGMIVIMLIGGYRDWRIIAVTTVLVLSFIYVVFVVVANLPAPEGPLGI